MQKIKVVTVIGTRPEAIKMAPLLKELDQRTSVASSLIVTGQHKEMLDQVLETFALEADHNLNIMQPSQTLTTITVKVLEGLDPLFHEIKPDLVLVHGDTTTTFAASIAAFYQQIPVGHVEAGLRTGDKFSPYPEEMNRKLAAAAADWHFAPTAAAENNLLRENIPPESIFVTGNTAIDALALSVRPDYTHPILDAIDGERFIILTTHRRENAGEGMKGIFTAIQRLLEAFTNLHVVYPVHKNPQIRALVDNMFTENPRLHLTEPLETVDFHNIASRAALILTDSGGIQEEAPSFGVPVLVLRENTERPEGVEAGVLKLVGTSPDVIVREASRLLEDEAAYTDMADRPNPYGDGRASVRIVDIIEHLFALKEA
ncbi:non-hydrolyzing UDP-N-acetylglucosamine 2-epimerase [Sinobaca sp. H24]|uniref:non-hydrolyzing UDP-N-acetylglucosamine 2-epimerase n=1 Tax=Sinobaca sp. H24 TaxID=2923376 RepID=UPI0020799A8D|nr:UDP-N-acetylglucosamine 2-epimerase (non-hydrolyzing) [Sinobaca sp. H24]